MLFASLIKPVVTRPDFRPDYLSAASILSLLMCCGFRGLGNFPPRKALMMSRSPKTIYYRPLVSQSTEHVIFHGRCSFARARALNRSTHFPFPIDFFFSSYLYCCCIVVVVVLLRSRFFFFSLPKTRPQLVVDGNIPPRRHEFFFFVEFSRPYDLHYALCSLGCAGGFVWSRLFLLRSGVRKNVRKCCSHLPLFFFLLACSPFFPPAPLLSAISRVGGRDSSGRFHFPLPTHGYKVWGNLPSVGTCRACGKKRKRKRRRNKQQTITISIALKRRGNKKGFPKTSVKRRKTRSRFLWLLHWF